MSLSSMMLPKYEVLLRYTVFVTEQEHRRTLFGAYWSQVLVPKLSAVVLDFVSLFTFVRFRENCSTSDIHKHWKILKRFNKFCIKWLWHRVLYWIRFHFLFVLWCKGGNLHLLWLSFLNAIQVLFYIIFSLLFILLSASSDPIIIRILFYIVSLSF